MPNPMLDPEDPRFNFYFSFLSYPEVRSYLMFADCLTSPFIIHAWVTCLCYGNLEAGFLLYPKRCPRESDLSGSWY